MAGEPCHSFADLTGGFGQGGLGFVKGQKHLAHWWRIGLNQTNQAWPIRPDPETTKGEGHIGFLKQDCGILRAGAKPKPLGFNNAKGGQDGPVAIWCRSFDNILCSKGDELWDKYGRMNFVRMLCGSR